MLHAPCVRISSKFAFSNVSSTKNTRGSVALFVTLAKKKSAIVRTVKIQRRGGGGERQRRAPLPEKNLDLFEGRPTFSDRRKT